MNIFKKIFVSCLALCALFSATAAFAAAPSLYFGTSSDNDSVPVTVNADPNANVLFLYSTTLGPGIHLMPIGTTNASGYLSAILSTRQYGIIPGSGASVTVNGQASAQSAWPMLSSGASGSLSLSQTSLSLVQGQQSSVAAYAASGAAIFVSNNSNPSIASASLSGSQVLIAANSSNISGTTIINVCYQSNASNCATLSVSVSSSSSGATSSTLSFNQNNLSLNEGQTLTVLISGNGGYSVADDSNTSIARATISGNAAIVTGYSFGTANIKICESDGQCATLYVTVTLPGHKISFDQSSVTLAIGQSLTVNASGGSGYYVSSNSNTNALSASATSNSSGILLFANNPGTASITVCGSGGSVQCGVINATVTGATASSGTAANTPATFSQTNITLSGAGQTQAVQVYGNGNYGISSNSNSSVASAALSGSTVTVTANNPGTTAITVCQAGIQCGTFFVTVSGTVSGTNSAVALSTSSVTLAAGANQLVGITSSGSFQVSSNTSPSVATAALSGSSVIVSAINSGSTVIGVCLQGTTTCSSIFVNVGSASAQSLTMNPSTVTLAPGAGQPVQIYGSGTYYVSNNTNPGVATAVVSGNGIIVNALAYGTANITVCQNGTQCGVLPIVVAAPAVPAPAYVPPAVVSAPPPSFAFTLPLHLGSVGAEVRKLQAKLKTVGYYSHSITGTYGPVTEKAVKAFQKAAGLKQLGSVGPGTRAALNSR